MMKNKQISFTANYCRKCAQKKTVVIMAMALLLLAGGASALSNSGGGSWQNYKEIAVKENSGGTLTDYQVLVQLSSSNFPTNARSDGADIRFTDANGNELSYWIESWDYSGKSTKIWVKVPTVAASAVAMIRMYYGNPSAGSSSSGEATFIFFDDFLGNNLDSNKWTKTGDIGYTALANSVVTFYPASGSDSGHRTYWNSKYPISFQQFVIQTKMKLPTNQNEYGVRYFDGSGSIVQGNVNGRVRSGNNGMVYEFYDSQANNYNIGTLTSHDPGFNIWRLERIADNNAKVSVLISGTWYAMSDVRNPVADDYNFGFWIHNTAYADYFQADWIFVAKLTQPEPTVTLGAEQPILKVPSLTLAKSTSPSTINEGEITTVTIRVENTGGDAKSVRIADAVPQGFTLVSGATSQEYSTLKGSEYRTFQYTMKAIGTGRFITDLATVTYQDDKGNSYSGASNSATITVQAGATGTTSSKVTPLDINKPAEKSTSGFEVVGAMFSVVILFLLNRKKA